MKKLFKTYSDHIIKDEDGNDKTNTNGIPIVDDSVKAEFNVTLNGYIVPETVSTGPYVNYKGRNKTTVRIGMEEKVI